MAITQLLTRNDGSAGRTKEDLRPPANRTHFWHAEEMNNVLDAVVAMLAELGLSDGSTPNSILRKLLSFAGTRSTRFVISEDFDTNVKARFTTTETSATVTVDHTGHTGAGSGMGHLRLNAQNVAAAIARARETAESVRGSMLPELTFKFRTPSTFVGVNMYLGIENALGTAYALMRCNGSGTVQIESRSNAGGTVGATATTTVLGASTWYEGKIQVLANSVRFYIDNALIYTMSTANAAPDEATDALAFVAVLSRTAGGPHEFLVDWYELAGARL